MDDGPVSSFQGRSSRASASSFHASLLQAINGVMSLALCPQVVSQASQHFRSSEEQAFTPACPGQYTHMSFRRWMSTIDAFQSALHIPLFTFCSKLTESLRRMVCVVRLSPLEAIQRRAWVTASTSIVKLEVETV